MDPWLLSADEVVAALATDGRTGLSSDEAAARLARIGPNRLDAATPVPAWRKLLGHLADPLVYLLLAAVVVSLVVWFLDGHAGMPVEAVVITVIVVLNALLGWAQEARAEQAVAALQRMAAGTARVVRGGRELRVPTTDLVPGDLLVLSEGDAVGADARVITAASLTLAEAALTGESEPVEKATAPLAGPVPLGNRLNMVFDGTAVTRGRGRAVVTATGMTSEMGAVARLLGETAHPRTPLQREVDRIGRTLGGAVVVIAVVAVGAILLTTPMRDGTDLVDVLLIGVSLAVAAVPEGLPAVLSVVLALGVQRMARRHALVKSLASVETLGCASIVCSDKTGTLTTNEMTIVEVVTGSGEVELTGSGYDPHGEAQVGGQPVTDARLLAEVAAVLEGGSLTNDAVLVEAGGRWIVHGDPTEAAFLVAEAKAGDRAEREARYERVAELPFSPERKLMTTVQEDRERGVVVAVTKGAPDVLLGRCTHEQVAGEVRPLTEVRRHAVLATVDRLTGLALRTLAVASRTAPDGTGPGLVHSIEHDLVLLGVVGILDPPRPQARAAIGEAVAAGMRVLMVTGDHPGTASRIAADLGIASPGDPVLTGAQIDEMDVRELAEALRDAAVCARVAPVHKLRIVDALHLDGEIVAMTGDGVNDAPALKAADIGVAMGRSGTDVAKEAADVVLADDDFATIVAAVREGRGIFANIRKFLRFLLSSNVGEVLTMLAGVLLAGPLGMRVAGDGLAVPLLATQILWINLLTDTGPALAMGVDPAPADVMDRPPRRLTDRVIDREMWVDVVWIAVVMAVATLAMLDRGLAGGWLGGTGGVVEARTMAFTTLVLAQLFNALNARAERASAFVGLFANRWLWGALVLSAVLQAAVVQLPFLNSAFATTPLGATDWLLCLGSASLVLWVSEARKLVRRRA
jgi:magnesium-transporting ATPase (P-type)